VPANEHFTKMIKIAIGLIHHNNVSRVYRSRYQISLIQSAAEGLCEFICFETAYQVPIDSLDENSFLKRESEQSYLSHLWNQYRGLEDRGSRLPSLPTIENRERAAIEIILTDKHIRAWDQFLETGADWLLLMEDDVVFTDESLPTLLGLFEQFYSVSTPTYVDLGGGFSISALGIGDLIEKIDGRMFFFKRPVTNTTCCYLMNSTLARILKRKVTENPSYRQLPADWLLSRCFIDLSNDQVAVRCLHFYPPAMIHGSIHGFYTSTLQVE
jgi:hypothetical protein